MRPLIVALDVDTEHEALELVGRLQPQVDLFKVGPGLFMRYGPPLAQQIHRLGARVFLDLKLHDIPSAVARAVRQAGMLGVYSLTLHALGGLDMLVQSARVKDRPRLWAVTVLTSFDQEDLARVGISQNLTGLVRQLSLLVRDAGLDGVVASVQETSLIKRECGSGFQVIAPGIRLDAMGDDQKRAQTPRQAIQAGADFIVVGRPILEARDPVQEVRRIYESLEVSV